MTMTTNKTKGNKKQAASDAAAILKALFEFHPVAAQAAREEATTVASTVATVGQEAGHEASKGAPCKAAAVWKAKEAAAKEAAVQALASDPDVETMLFDMLWEPVEAVQAALCDMGVHVSRVEIESFRQPRRRQAREAEMAAAAAAASRMTAEKNAPSIPLPAASRPERKRRSLHNRVTRCVES